LQERGRVFGCGFFNLIRTTLLTASQRPVPSKKTAAAPSPAAETVPVAPAPPAPDIGKPPFRHDWFFKEFFCFLSCAESLMREVLPKAIISAVDWAGMTLVPTSYFDEETMDLRMDLLFRAPLKFEVKGKMRECCCMLHLEGQSTDEQQMGLRVSSYQNAFWRQYKRENPRKPLPVIFSVVVYNGKTPWRGKDNFEHLVGSDWPPDLRAVAEPFIPKFKFTVIDVVRMEREKLAGEGKHKIGLDMLRIARDGDIVGFILRHSKVIKEMKAEGGQQEELLKVMAKYLTMIEPENGKKGVEKLRETLIVLPEEERKPTMTLFEILYGERLKKDLQQGLAQGIEQVREQGREQGLEQGREEGIGIGVEKGELIGEIRAFQRMSGRRVASKQELSGKPVPELKKLLAQVRKECLAVAR
jgi:hypothetical protein